MLVGSAERGGVELVSVVMGTGSEGARNSDTLLLMEYGFRRYRRAAPLLSTTRRPLVPGTAAATVKVKHGDEGDVVRVVPARTVRVVTRRDERALATPVGLPRELEGPLPARSRVGTLVVRLPRQGRRPRAARHGALARACLVVGPKPVDREPAGDPAAHMSRGGGGR